jgi:hypothetical protein
MGWSAEGRNRKQEARNNVVSALDGPSKGLLLMPGEDCRELPLLKEAGVLTADTDCTFVEWDSDSAAIIMDRVTKLWGQWGFTKKPRLHAGEFATLPRLDSRLDLVHQDLFGNLTFADAICLRDVVRPAMLQDGWFYITFSNATRGNRFMPAAVEIMQQYLRNDFSNNRVALTGDTDLGSNERSLVAAYTLLFERFIFGRECECYFLVDYVDEQSPNLMMQMAVTNFTGKPDLFIEDYYTPLPRERKSHMTATKTPKTTNTTCLARQILEAETPAQKAVATRRLRAYIRERESQGANPVMVEAGIKAAMTRLQS